MFITAIIAGGGRGVRFGDTRPKQLVAIGGWSMLERSVATFLAHPAVSEVVVALPKELADDPPPYLRGAAKPLRVVVGGDRRQDSVAIAFRAVSDRSDVIVIHDAARPFVSADLITKTIAAAAESGASLAAMQARDTVKRTVGSADARHYRSITETLPRESIFLAQTPQAFRRDVLRDALALGDSDAEATDEAALAERAGHTVRVVDGETSNIKITTPDDVPAAEAIARARAAANMRIGVGYDLHRLGRGRPLVLGGVIIPNDRGLQGHSDADAVCHALTDAVLGAAVAGDIGGHFPDTDPRWRGVSSLDLLARAVAVVAGRGFTVANVDVVVIAEGLKLGPFIAEMRAKVAGALGVADDQVSIKGKTNEGVGELGRGEAIAVHAVALLTR